MFNALNLIFVISITHAQSMFEYGGKHRSTTDILQKKWELLMQGKDEEESPFKMESMYTPIIREKMNKFKSDKYFSKTVLSESQEEKLIFYQSKDPLATCAIKMEME